MGFKNLQQETTEGTLETLKCKKKKKTHDVVLLSLCPDRF